MMDAERAVMALVVRADMTAMAAARWAVPAVVILGALLILRAVWPRE